MSLGLVPPTEPETNNTAPKQKRTIYVAGSSKEMDRAEKWMTKLREAGIEVVSTWCETVRKVGDANPMIASREQRMEWSATDLDEVSRSQAFWLLLPEQSTIGAYIELGYAIAIQAMAMMAAQHGIPETQRWILCSGTEKSIFTSLAEHFATDEEAFERLTAFQIEEAKAG